ncbi:MAG: PhnD/SsuA/transferrin family substrate-binding protein, partial [Thiohalomonadales bacterium]
MASAQQIISSILILIFSSSIACAEIVLTAPPRETESAGKKDYEPIAQQLSELLGERVVYRHPDNWTDYAKDMRSGKYDIVFDGPHFAAWRIANVGHIPLARLSGYLQFYVIAYKDDNELTEMKDLLAKSFCGLASPNLGTMA